MSDLKPKIEISFAGMFASNAFAAYVTEVALVAYVARGGGGRYEEILKSVLVEKEGLLVGQEATTRMLLGSVAPRCEFRVFRCRSLGGKKMGSSAWD